MLAKIMCRNVTVRSSVPWNSTTYSSSWTLWSQELLASSAYTMSCSSLTQQWICMQERGKNASDMDWFMLMVVSGCTMRITVSLERWRTRPNNAGLDLVMTWCPNTCLIFWCELPRSASLSWRMKSWWRSLGLREILDNCILLHISYVV